MIYHVVDTPFNKQIHRFSHAPLELVLSLNHLAIYLWARTVIVLHFVYPAYNKQSFSFLKIIKYKWLTPQSWRARKNLLHLNHERILYFYSRVFAYILKYSYLQFTAVDFHIICVYVVCIFTENINIMCADKHKLLEIYKFCNAC